MKLEQEICEELKKHPYLHKICLERKMEEDCHDYILKIEFCDFPNYCAEDKIAFIFLNVKNIQMKNLDGLLRTHIIVRDLRDRGLENINYYIKEEEEDMFSFYCSSIEIVRSTGMFAD